MTESSRKPLITVIGSVNVDYVMRVPSIPRHGETLSGSAFNVTLGGKGANQAVACARLGGDTKFIACVGNDAGGKQAVTAFRRDDISVGAIETVNGVPTGSAMIFVDDKGENCIGINPGANAELDETLVAQCAPLIETAGFLLMQLETPFPALTRAAVIARNSNTTVILNPAPACDDLPAALLDNVDILTPNETEAARLVGFDVATIDDSKRAAAALHAMGPDIVIVTLGANGALLSERGETTHIPTHAVQTIDTVAAGDTFNGALAVALSEGRALADAVRFANAAATLAVTRRGAQDAIPQRGDVDIKLVKDLSSD